MGGYLKDYKTDLFGGSKVGLTNPPLRHDGISRRGKDEFK